MTPTKRSLDLLRSEGYDPHVVEQWKVRGIGRQHAGRSLFILEVRVDLFNFGDILAIRAGAPHLIVQTTSYTGVSARVKKILAEPRALVWLQTGGAIDVHGWRKVPKVPGGKQHVWRPRIVSITQEMFGGA